MLASVSGVQLKRVVEIHDCPSLTTRQLQWPTCHSRNLYCRTNARDRSLMTGIKCKLGGPHGWLTHDGLTTLRLRTPSAPPSLPQGNIRDKDIGVQAATIHEWDQNHMEP